MVDNNIDTEDKGYGLTFFINKFFTQLLDNLVNDSLDSGLYNFSRDNIKYNNNTNDNMNQYAIYLSEYNASLFKYRSRF